MQQYQKHQQFYFHSVRFKFETLEEILKSGYILSREKSGLISKSPTFNGEKWISICKYYDPYYDYGYCPNNAFCFLVLNGLSIVLDNNLEATKTFYMSFDELYPGVIKEENPVRYSECVDEYQVRDSISREHFIALAYPYLYMLDNDKTLAKLQYDQIRYLLDMFHYDLPIVDSSSSVFDKELSDLEKRLLR